MGFLATVVDRLTLLLAGHIDDPMERMAPEFGSLRVADSEMYIRAQCMVIELLGGEVAELILRSRIAGR